MRFVVRGLTVVTLLALVLATEGRAEVDAEYRNIESVSKYPPDQFWHDLARNIVIDLGLDSQFDIVWRLSDAQLQQNQISFILFDSHEVDALKSNPLIQNCRYFSAYRIVTCDISMLRLLAQSFGLDKKVSVEYGANATIIGQTHTIYSREELEPLYRSTLKWIVGHEFGHAFHRHSGTFSILSKNDLAATVEQLRNTARPESSAAINRCHAFENEADDFFISLLKEDDVFRDIYGTLLRILNNAKSAANCPNQPIGYTCEVEQSFHGTGVTLGPGVVQAQVTATHPAFVLRVLDLLDKTWKPRSGEGDFHSQLRDYREISVKLRNIVYGGDVCLNEDG